MEIWLKRINGKLIEFKIYQSNSKLTAYSGIYTFEGFSKSELRRKIDSVNEVQNGQI